MVLDLAGHVAESLRAGPYHSCLHPSTELRLAGTAASLLGAVDLREGRVEGTSAVEMVAGVTTICHAMVTAAVQRIVRAGMRDSLDSCLLIGLVG